MPLSLSFMPSPKGLMRTSRPFENINLSNFGVVPCDTVRSPPLMEFSDLNLNMEFLLYPQHTFARNHVCAWYTLISNL